MLYLPMNSISKSVTVDAFWMDQTEITNNKYRQFVYYVRDSILRTKLGNARVSPTDSILWLMRKIMLSNQM